MRNDDWEVTVAEVSDFEAKVRVRFLGESAESLSLRGALRGPYCERAKTLPAEFPFRDQPAEEVIAEAVVTDPCLGTEELPHLYQADLEAVRGEEVVAEYHGVVGLRRTSSRPNWDHIK
jgi:hypothetical protein